MRVFQKISATHTERIYFLKHILLLVMMRTIEQPEETNQFDKLKTIVIRDLQISQQFQIGTYRCRNNSNEGNWNCK